mgnify:CR=1 FL=1
MKKGFAVFAAALCIALLAGAALAAPPADRPRLSVRQFDNKAGFSNFGATSVGTMSIRRFLRPVSFQNIPADLLPEDLR